MVAVQDDVAVISISLLRLIVAGRVGAESSDLVRFSYMIVVRHFHRVNT